MVRKLIGLRLADWQGDRLSLWWRNLPPYQGQPVGYIGNFNLHPGDQDSLRTDYQQKKLWH